MFVLPENAAGTVCPVNDRIGIVVVAYNAASTLPRCSTASRAGSPRRSATSSSATTPARTRRTSSASATSRSADLPLTVDPPPARTSGTAATRRPAYRWAIEHDLDIVVLLHGDGQYAPEMLPDIVQPLDRRRVRRGARLADDGRRAAPAAAACRCTSSSATGSSRRSRTRHGRHGAERVAQRVPRLPRARAARDPVRRRTTTASTSTRRSSSSSSRRGSGSSRSRSRRTTATRSRYVNGLGYAARRRRGTSLRYRAHKIGFGAGDAAFASERLRAQGRRALVARADRSRGSRTRPAGAGPRPRVRGRPARGRAAQARPPRDRRRRGRARRRARTRRRVRRRRPRRTASPTQVTGEYDVIIAADVLEHVRRARARSSKTRAALLAPGRRRSSRACRTSGTGTRVLRVASGTFAYERRGILDRATSGSSLGARSPSSHARTATRSRACARPDSRSKSSNAAARDRGRGASRVLGGIDRVAVAVWPSMFAYQFLAELRPATDERYGATSMRTSPLLWTVARSSGRSRTVVKRRASDCGSVDRSRRRPACRRRTPGRRRATRRRGARAGGRRRRGAAPAGRGAIAGLVDQPGRDEADAAHHRLLGPGLDEAGRLVAAVELVDARVDVVRS